MLGIIGIVVGIALLIYGAYKGVSTIILAPLCGLLIALFNGMGLLKTFTDVMVPAVCNYVTAMLGPVLCGCVIAAIYNKSGAALSIANALYDLFTIGARKRAAEGETVTMHPIAAIITIYVIGTVLAYSGMNPVVLMFILFPIAMDLFEKSLIPREMGPVGDQTTSLVLQVGLLGAIGGVVAASPAFPVLTKALLSMKGPALFKVVLAVAIITGASGSGPAGLSATLPYLSKTFTSMGVSLNALHRVSVFSSQTLDTLPTNPGYIISTGIAEVDIKDSYRYVFITTVLNTTITALFVALLLTIFPGWA